MTFKEWFNEDEHNLFNYPEEAMEAAWNKALELAAQDVSKIALHHNTIVCAMDVINRHRTDQ